MCAQKPPSSPGGRIEIRELPGGEEIFLRPEGLLRFLVAAFLAFWLCGWALGEAVALVLVLGPLGGPLVESARELLPGFVGRIASSPARLPGPVYAFVAVWLVFWTLGGAASAWQLLRLLAGSDRYLLRPGRVTYRRCAGPFWRTLELRAGVVDAIVHRSRRERLLAVVGGKEVPLSAGVPRAAGAWLAGRLRESLGLGPGGTVGAAANGTVLVAPTAPAGWRATTRPQGGVVLDAPPEKSRRTAGCALLVALAVTSAAGAFVTVVAGRGRAGLTGVAAAAAAVVLAVDVLCAWAAFAREVWIVEKGTIERVRTLGRWSRRRAVRRGTLAATLSTDDDGDDWFTLEVRGEGRPLRLARSMNEGSEVVAFARFAAWHSGFPLELSAEVLEAAGEDAGG